METKLYPLFSTKNGQPFVFWDASFSRLLICHGKRLTTVYYDASDAFSCQQLYPIFPTHANQEQYLYSNGRIVASYLPQFDALIVKRDGELFSFTAENPPIGYTTGLLDTPNIISYCLALSHP